MTEPKISVIIPFVSVNAYVIECLSACLSLEYKNFDVVLLSDEKIELPTEFSSDIRLKVIVTGKLTISAKRNIGISQSPEAKYLAFIDSDAYPDKKWLKNAVEAFSGRDDIWIVGGPNVCPREDKKDFRKRVVGNAVRSMLVSGMSAFNFREGPARNGPRHHLPTCNLIAKREAIEKIGGFDETYITGEDMKFSWTALKKGGVIFFSKDVLVYHHPRSIFMPFIRQRLTYGLSVPRIMRENPGIHNFFYTVPALAIASFVILASLALLSKEFLWLLLAAISFYFVITFFEALHWSERPGDIPLTFITIIIAQFTPAIGTFAAILNLPIATRNIYHNYED